MCRKSSTSTRESSLVSGRGRSDDISDVIQQLGWLRADELAEYHTICAVQRAITTSTPEYISQTIGPIARETHNHNTRNAGKVTQPRARTETGRRRLCIRGVTLLNRAKLDPRVPAFRAKVERVIRSRGHRIVRGTKYDPALYCDRLWPGARDDVSVCADRVRAAK